MIISFPVLVIYEAKSVTIKCLIKIGNVLHRLEV
jgi:hypothetical protein